MKIVPPIYQYVAKCIPIRISKRHFYRWIDLLQYEIITDKETSCESGANSATTTLLSNLIGIIRKSIKTDGHIVSEKERNKTFIFSDLLTIRKFADIIGIDIDERKFRDRRGFQRYFREIMKVELGKEDLL